VYPLRAEYANEQIAPGVGMGDSTVMLSAAKHLAAHRDRPFVSLKVTPGGSSMWDSTVMLSAAKHLAAYRDRPFVSLRVTALGPISSSVLFFKTA
jgi:hypothetical protein